MVCSSSLTWHFVNNDYIKAEIIHSTIHVHHEVYVTAEITYNTVHVHHEALAWSWVVCGTPVWASPRKPWLLPHWGYIGVASCLCYMRLCYAYVMAMLWLLYGCCYSCCISQEKGCVKATMPAGREEMCLQFLWLLVPSSSLLALELRGWTLGSANSVNNKAVGIKNRISSTGRKCINWIYKIFVTSESSGTI